MATVQIAGLSNAQQRADGLPSVALFANIPGSPPLPGPRSVGLGVYPDGMVTDSEGFVLGSPQDPAPPPPMVRYYAPKGRTFLWKFKPLWEPSVFVPGKGWVNSTNSA